MGSRWGTARAPGAVQRHPRPAHQPTRSHGPPGGPDRASARPGSTPRGGRASASRRVTGRRDTRPRRRAPGRPRGWSSRCRCAGHRSRRTRYGRPRGGRSVRAVAGGCRIRSWLASGLLLNSWWSNGSEAARADQPGARCRWPPPDPDLVSPSAGHRAADGDTGGLAGPRRSGRSAAVWAVRGGLGGPRRSPESPTARVATVDVATGAEQSPERRTTVPPPSRSLGCSAHPCRDGPPVAR